MTVEIEIGSWIGIVATTVFIVVHLLGHYPWPVPKHTAPVFIESLFAYAFAFFALVIELVIFIATLNDQESIVRSDNRTVNPVPWIGEALANTLWVAMFCAVSLGGAFMMFASCFAIAMGGALIVAAAWSTSEDFTSMGYVLLAGCMLVTAYAVFELFDYATRKLPSWSKFVVALLGVAFGVVFLISRAGLNVVGRDATNSWLTALILVKAMIMLTLYNIFVPWHPFREFRHYLTPFSDEAKRGLF